MIKKNCVAPERCFSYHYRVFYFSDSRELLPRPVSIYESGHLLAPGHTRARRGLWGVSSVKGLFKYFLPRRTDGKCPLWPLGSPQQYSGVSFSPWVLCFLSRIRGSCVRVQAGSSRSDKTPWWHTKKTELGSDQSKKYILPLNIFI